MIISQKTIEKLRELINEETEYRTGSQLVDFFNRYGARDIPGSGFPSRWRYTEGKLSELNGSPELDRCIKDLFAPVNFVGRVSELDSFIEDFNQYLQFDGWNVVREGSKISFSRVKEVDIDREEKKRDVLSNTEEDFLNKEFKDITIDKLPISGSLLPYLKARIDEIKACLSAKAPLSVIFLSGSTLEGILLGLAQANPQMYNLARISPKDPRNGKVRKFYDWTLHDLIDVSCEVGFLREDVKKFSHSLREFRNYIHPFQQMSEHFSPDENTAKICFQVLKAALYQIIQKGEV